MPSTHYNTVTRSGIEFLKSLLSPSPKTIRKINLVKRLLKDGKPLYKAIREAKLGWKNYYKYAPLIYDDPEIHVPIPKTILKDYRYRGMGDENMRKVLDIVAKYAAAEMIMNVLVKKNEKERIPEECKKNPGKEWLKVCRALQMKWMHELWLQTLYSI